MGQGYVLQPSGGLLRKGVGLRAGATTHTPQPAFGVPFMKNPFKSSPTSKVEAQIAQLEAARVELTKKQSTVEKLLDEHKTAMRAFVRDNPSLDPPVAIRQSVADARDHIEAIIESIAEGDEQLRALRAELAAARDQEERNDAAKADEALAGFIDNEFAPELAKAAAIIGKACAAYLAKVPDGLAIAESRSWARPRDHARRHAHHFSRKELLAAIVAEQIFAVAPALFEERSSTSERDHVLARMFGLDHEIPTMRLDGSPPAPVGDPARVLLSDRLRARAAARRTGEPTRPDVEVDPPEAKAPEPKRLPDVQVFATRDFAFVENAAGRHALCGARWVHLVPALVAEAALERRVGLRTDTAEGRDAFEAEKASRKGSRRTPDSGLSLAECFNLGDPCGYMNHGQVLAAAE